MMQLLSFLQGPSGKASAARVNTSIVVVCIMLSWGYVSIKTVTMSPMPETVAAVLLGALGFQVWHKGRESNGNGSNDKDKAL